SFVALEEAMNPRASLLFACLISVKRFDTWVIASSQPTSSKESPFRINGYCRRSSKLTYSQPNIPLTQVEIPFAGESCCGSRVSTFRSFFHTSLLHPARQYVQTVFVFSSRSSLIAAYISDAAISKP